MVKQYNMHEAKTHFSQLAQLVESGEEVLIARKGVPVMRLVPIAHTTRAPRDFSRLKGLIGPITSEQWEAMDREILESIVYSEWDD